MKRVHIKRKDFNCKQKKTVHEEIKDFQCTTNNHIKRVHDKRKDLSQNCMHANLSFRGKGFVCTKCDSGKRTFLTQKMLKNHVAKDHSTIVKKKCRGFVKKIPVKTNPIILKNYSNVNFVEATTNLLSKGRKFIPTHKINKSDILASLLEMERKIRMKWHFYIEDKKVGVEDLADETIKLPIKMPKSNVNLSNLYQPTQPIMNFITSVKGAIISATSKHIQSNLPSDDKEALENLITLQKKGLIVVTRTDKTGGFAIVDRSDYVNSVNMVLQNKIINDI